MKLIIKEKIIPLFRVITTYDKLYEIIEPCLEKGKPDIKTNYMQGIFYSFSNENIFWLCVKYRNINACKKYINEAIKVTEICLNEGERILSNEYNERLKIVLAELMKYKYLLENDFEGLTKIIKEKEQINIEAFSI